MSHYHRVFGMLVRSEVDIPELVESNAEEWANEPTRQVIVQLGQAPPDLPGAKSLLYWISASPTETLFNVTGRGKILSSHGKRLMIELESPEKLVEIRPYLIGCGFSTLAFHRGWIPLHMGAVRSPRGVILFCGPSGAGKSTTSLAVAKLNGWQLLADDMVVLEPGPNPIIHLGVKRIKLWGNAAESLGIDTSGLQQDFFRPHKFHVPIEGFGSFSPSEVVAILSLEWGGQTSFQSRSQAHTFNSILTSIYPPILGEYYLEARTLYSSFSSFFPVAASGVLVRNRSESQMASVSKAAKIVNELCV